MAIAYYPRLLCLCMAAFFLLHAAFTALLRAATPWLLRRAERLRPRLATHVLFTWRMAAPALAALLVTALCVPNYLLLEKMKPEKVGALCGVAMLGCLVVTLLALARGTRALAGAHRFGSRLIGQPALSGAGLQCTVLDQTAPVVALTGLFTPHAVISRPVLRQLTPEQLDLALRHERAHWHSRDNLKRLLFLLAPDALPGLNAFATLDRAWERFSEWAADDQATAGDAHRSLSLAGALVCVARLGVARRPSALATSLIEDGDDLAARVDRLVVAAPATAQPRLGRWLALGAATATGLVLATATLPLTQHIVHEALERLVH